MLRRVILVVIISCISILMMILDFFATKTATKMIRWNMSNSARRHLEHHQYHFNRSSHQTLIFSGPAKQARTSKHQTTTTHTHTHTNKKKHTHQTTETQNHTPTTTGWALLSPRIGHLVGWRKNHVDAMVIKSRGWAPKPSVRGGIQMKGFKAISKWRKMNPYSTAVSGSLNRW